MMAFKQGREKIKKERKKQNTGNNKQELNSL